MKIEVETGNQHEMYITCKSEADVARVLEAVKGLGTWTYFTKKALYCKDCTYSFEPMRKFLFEDKKFDEKEVVVFDPQYKITGFWYGSA